MRNAFAEVNNSLDAISRYQEQLTELLAQQDVAQETLRIAQNRYRNGYSSYLDVLTRSARCSRSRPASCR